jgi:hypothetical protein
VKRVHFETNPTDRSRDYAQLVDLILLILNRISVELTLESQRNKSFKEEQFRVAVPLIHSACSLGTMLPDLVKERSVRLPYAFPIARMYYERLLSAAYVMSDSGDAAKRAIHYSVYSLFKNQKKLFSAGGHQEVIQERYNISRKSEVVAEALAYFEKAKSSQEFEHDRLERCEVVNSKSLKAGILFQSVEQSGHSIASEVVHGSYLSTILFSIEPRNGTVQKGLDEVTSSIMTIVVLSSEALGHLLVKLFPEIPSPPLLIDAGKTFLELEVPEAIDLISRAYIGDQSE